MLSMEYGLTGPVITQVAACATSVIAFHDALRLIRDGECDVVLTGGSEAPIWPMGLAALANMTALSKRNDDPGDGLAAVRRARATGSSSARGPGWSWSSRSRTPGSAARRRWPRSSAGR